MQRTLFERALQFRAEHTQRADTYEGFKEVMEGRPGFVIAPWCGAADCEAQIKADTQAATTKAQSSADKAEAKVATNVVKAEGKADVKATTTK